MDGERSMPFMFAHCREKPVGAPDAAFFGFFRGNQVPVEPTPKLATVLLESGNQPSHGLLR